MPETNWNALRGQLAHVINMLIRWLEIRQRWEPPQEHVQRALRALTDVQLRADIDHSSLLLRLLAGQEPLPIPPPLAYSYPWYELAERGEGESSEVWENGLGQLIINQHPWRILQRVSDREFIVTYRKAPEAGQWRVWTEDPITRPIKRWRIKRI